MRLIGLGLACLGLCATVQAVNPPPDGGYPNQNTAEGTNALFSLTSGSGNTAVGFQALYSTTIGGGNTANGVSALYTNTIGNFNTAAGGFALYSNINGSYNAANGYAALYGNTTGQNNLANGYAALTSNTTGDSNTANGYFALGSNQTGNSNTATGHSALQSNIDGFDNTANGVSALYSNTDGAQNTANGVSALYSNTSGYNNTANGSFALLSNTNGNYNTACGDLALSGNTTGDNNIALGKNAGANLTTGNNNIAIGHPGVAGESKHIRIGKAGTHNGTYIAGIYGTTVPNGVQVVAGSNGRLGTVVSSSRFKEAIRSMDKASEAILALKPVTFRYKHELDPEGIAQFGLVAEEVEKVSPDLVARDEKGKAYTVRYEAVNAMLLNEFLKEHRKVEELEAKITVLTASLEEQASQIQKVSDQIQLTKAAPQVVLNNQ